MPADGRISSTFGSRFHPIDKRVKFHGGLDIAVPTGSKVVASADGIVKFAGWKGGYGNVVIIEHPDGSETLYGHNSKLMVTEGQKVGGGDPISLSGSTGKSTGPHLHFEMRRNGQLVNPSKFLSNVLSNTAER
jgi:murein DD-endopeptidase MepM/ murein hydrolase activator NlpD